MKNKVLFLLCGSNLLLSLNCILTKINLTTYHIKLLLLSLLQLFCSPQANLKIKQ